ncbi:TylF/MycF/NovP-related O-methyltransferase [Aminobacter anthyllidis]|uniref:TylF/MycF/NovP-related O-methyltransferase n=1 Tax=Aminobacter anthyllidis TaxID=1035067 RepID=UPI0024551306|nr:TylF/MycF/NovP-related O-methyltransferase [Aminobacter anthyllidis]MDH4988523.1 TylF/MycF/NovP-related O-methyltransferase [Aminobacter anthyllidis]
MSFDPIFYLYANPDVAAAGVDPHEHFEKYGRAEGRVYALPQRPQRVESEFLRRREFFAKAFNMLSYNRIGGDYAEFGCGGGATLTMAYRESTDVGEGRTFWAFDSFKGLPPIEQSDDQHPEWHEGAYAVSEVDYRRRCRLAGVPEDQLRLVAGYYDNSLTKSDIEYPQDIALAYVDCDLFSSTTTVLQFLRSRLKNGMLLAFDDYFCHTQEGKSGEQKAFDLFRQETPEFSFEPYLTIGWHGQSFIAYRR